MKDAVLELEEKGGAGDSFQITARDGDAELYVSVENPWAGDTVSGFGAVATFQMNREGAEQLMEFLAEWLKTPNLK